MKDIADKKLISFRDATVRYGISRQTLYRCVARGDLALIKIGRASRLKICDADRLFRVHNGNCA